jgi:hypothetical protein
MNASDISIERWLEHKADIHQCYVIENKTLPKTRAFLREVHGFTARSAKCKSTAKALTKDVSKSQYTTKLKAWGFTKYNRGDIYPRIEGSLKRKRIDLDSIESVTIPTSHGDKLIPYKQLKKALGRSDRLGGRSDDQSKVVSHSIRATLTACEMKRMLHLPRDSRFSIELVADILTWIPNTTHASISSVNSPNYSRFIKPFLLRNCRRKSLVKAKLSFLLGQNLWR